MCKKRFFEGQEILKGWLWIFWVQVYDTFSLPSACLCHHRSDFAIRHSLLASQTVDLPQVGFLFNVILLSMQCNRAFMVIGESWRRSGPIYSLILLTSFAPVSESWKTLSSTKRPTGGVRPLVLLLHKGADDLFHGEIRHLLPLLQEICHVYKETRKHAAKAGKVNFSETGNKLRFLGNSLRWQQEKARYHHPHPHLPEKARGVRTEYLRNEYL